MDDNVKKRLKKRNWDSLRMGFRCFCDRCRHSDRKTRTGRYYDMSGKMWQAMYGESSSDFRKRYAAAHKETNGPKAALCGK